MSKHTKEQVQTALLLIRAIAVELKNGTEHYDVTGVRLTTVKQVLEALKKDGRIEVREKQDL